MEIYVAKLPDWCRTVSVDESVQFAEGFMQACGVKGTATARPDAKPFTVSPYSSGIHQYLVARCDRRSDMADIVRFGICQLAQAGFAPLSMHEIVRQRLEWENTKLVPVGTPLICEGEPYSMETLRLNTDVAAQSFFLLTVDNWDDLPDAPKE